MNKENKEFKVGNTVSFISSPSDSFKPGEKIIGIIEDIYEIVDRGTQNGKYALILTDDGDYPGINIKALSLIKNSQNEKPKCDDCFIGTASADYGLSEEIYERHLKDEYLGFFHKHSFCAFCGNEIDWSKLNET